MSNMIIKNLQLKNLRWSEVPDWNELDIGIQVEMDNFNPPSNPLVNRYLAEIRLGSEFRCADAELSKMMRYVIVPSFRRTLYGDIELMLEKIRRALFEQNRTEAIKVLGEIYDYIHSTESLGNIIKG